MNGQRAKLLLLLASLAATALVFLSWTQTWFAVPLAGQEPVIADGSVAAPALTALALAELALLGAIAIAGPMIRVVLSALQLLVGVTIAFSSAVALRDPVTAAATAITQATGVSGMRPSLAGQVDSSAWPVVAVAGGILIAVLAVLELLTARSWPGSSRRYSNAPVAPADGGRSAVDDWDALSRGGDPTSGEGAAEPDETSR